MTILFAALVILKELLLPVTVTLSACIVAHRIKQHTIQSKIGGVYDLSGSEEEFPSYYDKPNT